MIERDASDPPAPFEKASRIGRRTMLTGVAGLLTCLTAASTASPAVAEMPEVDRLRFLQVLADIAIPATGTAGAGTMDIVQWIDQALSRGMRGGSVETLMKLKQSLNRKIPGGTFMLAPRAAQIASLSEIDAVLPAGPSADLPPWGIVKSLILRAYYTSETGASEELRYELVPGRFDAALPLSPETRALSTDQNARPVP